MHMMHKYDHMHEIYFDFVAINICACTCHSVYMIDIMIMNLSCAYACACCLIPVFLLCFDIDTVELLAQIQLMSSIEKHIYSI